jgi:hypothetical protein
MADSPIPALFQRLIAIFLVHFGEGGMGRRVVRSASSLQRPPPGRNPILGRHCGASGERLQKLAGASWWPAAGTG